MSCDFAKSERGKFFKEPTSEAVNEALRGWLALADETACITGRSKRIARKRAAVQ
jgi:hypothetical protein